MELSSGHKEVPLTHLRKLTLDEIARRNYTEGTTRAYLRIIEDLARYFHRSPDQLGPEHLREYTVHLFRDRKLSDNSVNQIVGALRFFFRKVLKRPWTGDEMPYPKKKMLGAVRNGAIFGGIRRSQWNHLETPMARTRYKTLHQTLYFSLARGVRFT